MSLHSTITATAVWPADLVTAGVVASTAAVYTGARSGLAPTSSGEVWIERLTVEEHGRGLQDVRAHRYRLHYRQAIDVGLKRSGQPGLDAVEAKLRTIVDRYNGRRPFYANDATIKAATAVEEAVSVDPQDERYAEGTVLVTLLVGA